MKKKSFLFSVFYFFIFLTPVLSYSQKKVEIIHAATLKVDDEIGNGAKRLIGNVAFKQDNALMFCDSAYFYSNNALDAFGHVHIQQGDSLNLYGDFLKYDGNTKKAVITKNVIVKKGDMQLTTDALNYDMSTSIGYYTTPARITNKDNVLTSDQGYYYSKINDLNFKKNVILTNPQFVINCDTMRYNTTSKITYFLGPTTIKSKENLIYCEDGWYNTTTDQSRFSKNSYIVTKEQKMFGDSLYYDRNKGIGRAIKNVQIIDTTQKINIKGEYAIHYEFTDLSIVTENALLTQFYEKDTLYLHADTLKSVGKPENEDDSVTVKNESRNIKQGTKDKKQEVVLDSKKESRGKNKDTGDKNKEQNDKTHNLNEPNQKQEITNKKTPGSDGLKVFAYHKVKFYKQDLQGKCDSLHYDINDSLMKLYGQPTLWSDQNQLTGDSMKVLTGEKSIQAIEIHGTGFIVSQEDSLHFNQIRGKYMKGFFKDNEMYRINVVGNGQTIYYAKEEAKDKNEAKDEPKDKMEVKDTVMGKEVKKDLVKEKEVLKAVNKADCSDLNIFFKDEKVEHITFITKPDATLYPLDKIDIKELKLKDFTWRSESRPLTAKDIFIWK